MPGDTRESAYADRLTRIEGAWWKRLLDVQRPYRWNLRRLGLGYVLDVGCGIGRNLVHLRGSGVGVDHNAEAIAVAKRRGLVAMLPDDFLASPYATPGRFDSLLLAHVAEHMRWAEAKDLVASYLPYVRQGGSVVLITPQEAGFRSDATHVEFMDLAALGRLARANGLVTARAYSFPFPRLVGRVFRYNEFVLVARKP
jgi:SAM-dependent methyltransferase